jgi:hypothetical protein
MHIWQAPALDENKSPPSSGPMKRRQPPVAFRFNSFFQNLGMTGFIAA